MNIEEIFKRADINYNKLIKYGFKKIDDIYVLEKKFLNNEFKAIVTIDKNGNVNSKIIELQFNEEYININTPMSNDYVNKVREEYKDILIDIRNNCFDQKQFISEQANRINKYIIDKYKNNPEFLWEKFPGYAVYRNQYNNKWYAIIMDINYSKLNNKTGEVEIINVKTDENNTSKLLKKNGYYKAYHMNKKDWISIVLDDTLKDQEIIELLDESYNMINKPEEWIVPANPKYYDIINAFNNNDEIIWKQSSDIHVNDIIYIYVAEPYSKILYKCIATEVNIPYEYKDNNVTMNRVMKIKLIKNLENCNYTFEFLNNNGIKAIRGPRKISDKMKNKMI